MKNLIEDIAGMAGLLAVIYCLLILGYILEA
jgi:hypothetical protein